MDNLCFGTLGGGTARYAKLGERPRQRHCNHDLAGSDNAGISDLGFRCRNARSGYKLVYSCRTISHCSAFVSSPFDQLCCESRRKGIRCSFNNRRPYGANVESTHSIKTCVISSPETASV